MENTLYKLDEHPPRYSSIRFRSHSRHEMGDIQPGRSIKEIIKSLDARIMYKVGTKAPLGDFPEADYYLIMSQKALDVFWDRIEIFFEKIPIHFTAGGVIRRSEIWEEIEISDLPAIPDKNDAYYYLHPCSTLMRGNEEPVELEEYVPRDFSKITIDPEELEKKLEEARKKYKGKLNEARTDIGTFEVPPVFAAGEFGEIYFTEEFVKLCKKNKLKGIKLKEVDNSDKING